MIYPREANSQITSILTMETEEKQVVLPEQEEQIEIELEETEETPATEPEKETDWKAEALKQKAIAQRLAKKLEGGKPEPKQELKTEDSKDIRTAIVSLQMAEKKRQFGYEHGLSPEETDAIFKISNNPTKETLDDPFVKGGLQSLRAKKRVAENTPSSSRSTTFSLPKGAENTTDARQKNLEAFVQKRFGKG